MILRLAILFCASCKFTISSFSEIAFRSSTLASATVSPSRVLTGVSSTSDREISISESGTDNPCSHFEIVCRTTFNAMASSCCESPLDFLMALMFSLSNVSVLLLISLHYRTRDCPLPQATHTDMQVARNRSLGNQHNRPSCLPCTRRAHGLPAYRAVPNRLSCATLVSLTVSERRQRWAITTREQVVSSRRTRRA